MLNKIIKFSLHNRFFVVIASVLLLIFGSVISSKMEVDVFPDLTAPTVVVLTEAHGMAPEEVEKLVTFPIETSVNGATNVRRVRSSSSAGISIVWVEFEWNTDIYKARQIVSEKITAVADKLPQGVGNPTMGPQSSIMGEIMLVSVTADKTSQIDLRTIADWTIRPRLLATGGVSQVVVIGGEYKQYQILASPQKMNYYNVSLSELLKASEEANGNSSGGFMNEYNNEYIVKGIGRTNEIEALGHSVIKMKHGNPIKIEDVAEIKIGASLKIGDGGRQLRILDEDNWSDNNGNPYDNGAEVAYIAPNGQYFQVSDKNKKENITKIEDASTKISKISGYTYQYKLKQQEIEKGQKQVAASGVLAQEIEQVLPQAIQKNESGEYFVDYAAITPLLIEAIKEQNTKIKSLETINAEILKRLEVLEKK